MPYKGLRPFQGRFFMALIPLLLLLSGVFSLHAQKHSEKTYDASSLTMIHIDAARIFEVILEDTDEDLLRVVVDIEGEYQNEMTLGAKKEGSTLYLKGVFLPSFEDPNDKLSAHKVLSVRVRVTVPRHLKVELSGLSTRVEAIGYFEDLVVRTSKGPVLLNKPQGFISVTTTGGLIRASGSKGFVSASAPYGHVYKGVIPTGRSTLVLRSVSGDIYINKHE